MLKRTPDTTLPGEAPAAADPVAVVAARIALRSEARMVAVVRDGQRGEAIAKAVAAFVPDAVVVHLISSDALPGEAAPPSAGNVGQRVAALRQLRLAAGGTPDARPDTRIVAIVSAAASAVRYPAPAAFDARPPAFSVGDPIDPAGFPAQAAALGYVEDDRVDEPGEIAIRGTVIDIFPADRPSPVRIEFADGTVTALRAYDPVTQLGTEAIETVVIGQASEPDAGEGVTILDHLPGAAILLEPGAQERRDAFLALAADGAPRRRAPAGLVDATTWAKAIGDAPATLAAEDNGAPAPPRFVERADPIRAFRRFAKPVLADGRLVLAGAPRDLRFLRSRIGTAAVPAASLAEAMAAPVGSIALLEAPVERGFVHAGCTVIAAADLLGSRAQGEDAPSAVAGFAGTGELHIGDVVVHEDHGIGCVVGLETPQAAEGEAAGDHIVLEYAKGARRLVPVEEANRIWRYGADREAVTLDTLDGASWQKRRAAIDAAIAESARALAAVAAERDARRVDPIAPDHAAYERFAAGFPFTETADQARAIAAVRADLASGRAMDRLVVGDVGYGKTEVALRAVALVALAGRQAAIVAPTTVLVRQHLDSVRRRFAGTGVEVAGLSRLSTPAERKRVLAGLADGSIQVVVGTSAVAGKAVRYADLALVAIDEEQRFGAAAKAGLRSLGAGHVLTLSATPIPRTLQSALVGLQQISIIATPPARRRAIRTTVAPFAGDDVRKALLRERAAGGQSFVVVPRIEDIAPMAEMLKRLVPALGVVTAHGKMDAIELDEAMAGFANGDGDVLLATNIIEAGLDVPRANTMIVHHADRFGLSQLHQLRGRVGRGQRRGQILLTTDGDAQIAEATLKRLRTLQALDQLGAGFAISARDLDMRGAGDLIGEEQAGHMKLIGVDLYQHLLGHALRVARGEAADRWQPVLSFDAMGGATGRLPDDWIPEADLRLSLYGQLAHLDEVAAIDAFQAELEDRFGPVPEPAQRLLDTARIAALAADAGIRQIDAGPAAIALTLADPRATLPAPFEPVKHRWLLRERIDDPADRIERLRDVLDGLGTG
jgi:transcription-repair coupling factor (superfamily II helicase)